MSPAYRFLRTDAAGSYTPPTLVPRPMDFFQLQDRFWRMHNEENFSPVASMLYSYWLNRFNIGNGPQDRWPGALSRKVTQVAADLGLNENTVAKARTELEKRGLVCYRAGNKTRAAQWGLEASAFKIALKNSGQSEGIDLKISGQCESDYLQMDLKNSGQNGIIDLKISGPYKEENIVVKTEDEGRDSSPSSSAPVQEEITSPQPASQKAEPQTDGGRRAGAFDDPADDTDADHTPMLVKAELFRLVCIDEGYTGIDYEHYRREIQNASRDEQLKLPARKWRARVRRWLSSEKKSRSGLVMAAVPGQTKGDPRAVQPLAAKSSASPTKKQSWS